MSQKPTYRRKGIEAAKQCSRRNFLKLTGAGSVVAIAGCGGQGNGDGTPAGDNQTTTAGTTERSGGDDSNVSLTYWDTVNAQSRNAQLKTELLVETFESDSGATIQTSWDGFGDAAGNTWVSRLQQGNRPVIYDSSGLLTGKYVEGDWILPFDDYMDQIDDEIIENIEWMFPDLRNRYSGFEGDKIYEIPYSFVAATPFVARTDHFEQAGLDPASDFPPENFEDLVTTATTLQNEGPGDWGFQIHGGQFDILDEILMCWTQAEGGQDGLFLTEDWSDTNFDNQTWKSVVSDYVEIYREHELSNGGTPSFSDENTIPLMANGSVSMTQHNFLNYPTLSDQASSLVSEGDIQYGMPWGGNEDSPALPVSKTKAILRKPDNADAATWERKQEAAINFLELWLSRDVQMTMFEDFGAIPVRQDVWSEIERRPSKIVETGINSIQNSKFMVSAHPQQFAIMYGDATGYFQQALSGEISPEEACDQAASAVRDLL